MSHLLTPGALLMVRPASFGYNPQTAATNAFQQIENEDVQTMQERALAEFDSVTALLTANKIEVIIIPDSAPAKPDAIFPNNWISTQPDGAVILYPMLAPNRRLERRPDIIELLDEKFVVRELKDFSKEELSGRFLEGTGSMVFDHANKIAYACRSERTNESLLHEVCAFIGYRGIVFDAVDENNQPVYHTNVMMWVGEKMAAVCIDSIKSEQDQDRLLDQFEATGHKVIAISHQQMKAFAGNMFEVKNKDNQPFLLMSQTAYQTLLPGQLNEMSKHAEPLIVSIDTIEKQGGGGIRCMVAGIYLQKK